MINLELDEEEAPLLEQILEDCLSELHSEISATDSLDYKEMLKSKKFLLLKIQKALKESKLEPVAG